MLVDICSGFLCVTSGRQLYIESEAGDFEYVGTLPNPHTGLERFSYDLKTDGLSAKLRRLLTGYVHSVNVWFLNEETVLGNATNYLFCSEDSGQTWNLIKKLHPSSGIRGILPKGLCYHDGTIYVGEYIFDESRSPRIFASDDFGQSWDTEFVLDGVRHVHAVQVDPFSGEIWITTGDRDSESKIGRVRDGELEVVGTGSQIWRAVELIFTPQYVLWGTDCPYQRNHIVKLHRDDIENKNEPEIIYSTDEPFYYSTSVEVGGETFALLSTGNSFSSDSTAPKSDQKNISTNDTIGIYGGTSESDFSEWVPLATFNVKKQLANRAGLHNLASNSYIFLSSSPNRGVFANPINTKTYNNQIININADPTSLKDWSFETTFSVL